MAGCTNLHALPAQNQSGTSKRQVIAVFPQRFPPIYSLTINDSPTGFGIDVIDAVAHIAGLKIKYVPVDTWDEAANWLQDGRADIIPNLGITDRRKQYAVFTRPIHKLEVSLLVFDEKPGFNRLSDLRNTQRIVGAVKTNVGVTILANERTIKSRIYPSLSEALLEMATDEIDAIIYPVHAAKQLSVHLRLKHDLKTVGEPLMEIPRGIAVSKHRPDLLSELDAALATFQKTDEYRKIYQRWYPMPSFWLDRRVAYIVGTFALIALLGFMYFRFKVLRRVNLELQKTNTFIKTILEITNEGILTLDNNGQIYSVNNAAENIFGRKKRELIGHSILKFMPSVEAQTFNGLLKTCKHNSHEDIEKDRDESFREYRFKLSDGKLFPVNIALKYTEIEQNHYIVCTIEDVSQLREAQKLADFYTSHDPLTGLINQNGFSILLENLLSPLKHHNKPLTCLHIDIEHMHVINSTHGYDVGDKLLIQFAEHLDDIINSRNVIDGDNNMLVRIDGNRFIIAIPEADTDRAALDATRIISEVEKHTFIVNDHQISITCRIGIATYPEHGSTPLELLSNSEAALRAAKTTPGMQYHIYVEEEDKVEKHTSAWAEKIIAGLREDRFFLLFQPILDTRSGDIRHFEALVRYQDHDGTIITPNEFIPVAERYGSIKRLDRRVIQLAISHLAGLDAESEDISIAINLSGANIGDDELLGWLESLLEENAIEPRHLVFEVTETASLLSLTAARSFIDAIKSLGCRIALDDFGTGLSSFTYLRNFPVDIVKIDGSFIRNLPNSFEDRVMVRSMVDVAHSLNKQVVAEFVSSREIYDIILDFGVDFAQGYYISKPVALHDFRQEMKDLNHPIRYIKTS